MTYPSGDPSNNPYGSGDPSNNPYSSPSPYASGNPSPNPYNTPSPYASGNTGYPPNAYSPAGTPPYGQSGNPPPNYLGWAIAAIIFFTPSGIFAIISSNKVESLWRVGDFAGAEKASRTTKTVSQLTVWISLGIYFLACFIPCIFSLISGALTFST